MIVAWIVKCDNCGKLIDATQETFHENYEDVGDVCQECFYSEGDLAFFDAGEDEDLGASIVNGELC
jgi:hypothetical protein